MSLSLIDAVRYLPNPCLWILGVNALLKRNE